MSEPEFWFLYMVFIVWVGGAILTAVFDAIAPGEYVTVGNLLARLNPAYWLIRFLFVRIK